MADAICTSLLPLRDKVLTIPRQRANAAVHPKRTDFAVVPDQEIRDVADLLNHRPRKMLDFRTSGEVFNNRFVALIS